MDVSVQSEVLSHVYSFARITIRRICDTDTVSNTTSRSTSRTHDTARQEFEQQLHRTVEYLRTMNLHKLERKELIYAFYVLAQGCADASRKDSGQPLLEVPRVKPTTFADQLQVLGSELLSFGSEKSLLTTAEALLAFRRAF